MKSKGEDVLNLEGKKTAKKVRFSTKTAALKPKTKHRDEDGKGKVNPLIPFSFLRKAR